MSATGRGSVRREADFYPTPAWCVRRLLESCALPGGCWLEPGAGEGAIIRAVNAMRGDVDWTAVELRPEAEPRLREALSTGRLLVGTYLSFFLGNGAFDVAIGNPPFSLAQAFVEHSQKFAIHVVFLLRLAFLESLERAAWWDERPADVYVFRDRPSFKGGGTDSCAYAWFHWHPEASWPAKLNVLPVTPESEKEEDRGQRNLFSPPEEPQELLFGGDA